MHIICPDSIFTKAYTLPVALRPLNPPIGAPDWHTADDPYFNNAKSNPMAPPMSILYPGKQLPKTPFLNLLKHKH